jgi:glycerol uptake facilitator-like aquaporin
MSGAVARRATAEFFGTAALLVVVVGSGIMGESLAQGNLAITLLANSMATGAGLYVLIQCLGPISGAHFNPAVSVVERFWRRMSTRDLGAYVAAQAAGSVVGVWLTHGLFGQALFQLSVRDRGAPRFLLSEGIATFGLIVVIALSGRRRVEATPGSVALYITAAYWCTSSTSFANPAVTLARSFTNTFTGIQWTGTFGFIVAQLIGAGVAYGLLSRLPELRRYP